MENTQLTMFLSSSPHISLAKAEEIAGHFNAKNIARNEMLLKEGHISNEYLFLESGFMRAFARNTNGNDITTGFYSGHQVVFEVSSFFNRVATKENIQAVTDCIGWCITYDQLNTLFHSIYEFREFGRSMLVQGYASLKMRMLLMIRATAEERYAALMSSNAEIFQHAPLKHIATYLGITDTSLSRIRKEFARK